MSDTLYYYALNRKAADRVVGLTWNQFLSDFKWGKPSQWKNIGGYFAFGLEPPTLPQEPTPEQIAPILKETIRQTLCRMVPQYFSLLELSYQMRKKSFVKVDLNAEGLEADCGGIVAAAVLAFLEGNIDDRTLWAVLTLHKEVVTDVLRSPSLSLTKTDYRRIRSVLKRYGRCQPIFDWQASKAVRDGHTALGEEDTRRFARFVRLAWRENWPADTDKDGPLLYFRDFELADKLHTASAGMVGNCLVRFYEDS